MVRVDYQFSGQLTIAREDGSALDAQGWVVRATAEEIADAGDGHVVLERETTWRGRAVLVGARAGERIRVRTPHVRGVATVVQELDGGIEFVGRGSLEPA